MTKRLDSRSSLELGSMSIGNPKRGFASAHSVKRLIHDNKHVSVKHGLNADEGRAPSAILERAPSGSAKHVPLKELHAGDPLVILDTTQLLPAIDDIAYGVVADFVGHG